jgi:3-dehydroquinate synthase/2-deoxy-scyllo-inosose synthase
MGGGMVGNVAGLASALLFRGIRLFHLPTTPIAAFDSVLSVKQAVNLRGGKNLCGTYHRPSLIACDLRWLAGAPPAQLLTGLAEMVKNVLAVVPDLEDELVEAIAELELDPGAALLKLLRIGRAAKEGHLRADPRERRQALVFEYGHTMGHALEFTSRGEIDHGEAVGWGMLVAAEVSHGLGHLSGEDVERHYRLLSRLRLPDLRGRLERIDPRQLRAVLCRDNKRGYLRCEPDQISMVLLESVGKHLTGPEGYPLVNVRADDAMRALDRVVQALDRRWVAASA